MLSENAQTLLQLREEILSRWSEQVVARIRQARNLSKPILINTLPAFFDLVAAAISQSEEPLADASATNTFAQEHGGERARLSFYDYDQLIQEYYILRQCIFDTARDHGLKLSNIERVIIHQSIDVAIKDAAMGFALVQSNIREQFIATLTHDLRNPLSAIKMAAELASEAAGSNSEAVGLLEIVVQNATRADDMIQDLLDASMLSAGSRLKLNIEPCDHLAMLHDTMESLVLQHGSRLQLMGKPCKGYADAKALRRALENLISNAIKYGSAGTPVTISLEEEHGRTIFQVHNFGPPVPFDELESIFQVFRRSQEKTHQRKQGWGLGLALVRGVAESHGGSISVESNAEKGTTFTLDVPTDARPFQESPTLGV